MSTFECERLVDQYTAWLKERVIVAAKDGMCIVTSPFVDRHHDALQIYVERLQEGYLLSDDGYVLRDLRISGVDMNSERRREALRQAISPFGVKVEDDELCISASDNDLPRKKHNLIQAMLAVGDLVHMAQPTVVALFKEDVSSYLMSHEVRFIPDVKLQGQSGFDHPFDFVVPSFKDRPERYIRAVNNPSRENVVELLFAWQDVQGARPSRSRAYAFLNDSERRVTTEHMAALRNYGIVPVTWKDRAAHLNDLLDVA